MPDLLRVLVAAKFGDMSFVLLVLIYLTLKSSPLQKGKYARLHGAILHRK